MPTFEIVSQPDAELKTAVEKRAKILSEYLSFVEQLKAGQAGRLSASEGETIGAVRRRIGAPAKLAGKDVVIKRVGEEIFFWAKLETGKRRGRPRKS
jgi:hypothetical protein